METNLLTEAVKFSQHANGNSETTSKKKRSDKRPPDLRFSVTPDVQAVAWRATHSSTGVISWFYQVCRMKGDKRTLTLRAQDLIPNAVALGTLAEQFAKDEATPKRLRELLKAFSQGIGQLVGTQAETVEIDSDDSFEL